MFGTIKRWERQRAIRRCTAQALHEVAPYVRTQDLESIRAKLAWWSAYLTEKFGPDWHLG